MEWLEDIKVWLRDSLKRGHVAAIWILSFTIVLVSLTISLLSTQAITFLQSLPLLVYASAFVFVAAGMELLLERGHEGDFGPGSTPLSVRLMWNHQFQFCGFYHAKREGGIDVQLHRGGAPVNLDPIACVLAGFDSFGIATAINLIRSYHQQSDFRAARIIPCLVIFRRSPVVLIAKRDREITIEALRGTCVAFFGRADSTYREYVYLEKKAGITNTRHVFLEDEGSLEHPVQVLDSNNVDYRVGYAFNEGVEAEMTGDFHWRYHYKVFGQTLAADVLFTRHDYWKTNEDTCRALVTKVREGYAACADDSVLVLDLLKEFAKSQYDEISRWLTRGKDVTSSLSGLLSDALQVPPGAGEDLFIGNEDLWKNMEDIAGWPSGEYTKELNRLGLFALR